jgi:signal peptidase I
LGSEERVSAIAVPGPEPRLLGARILSTAVLWLLGGLLFGICMSVTLPFFFGIKSLTVLSGSMEPTVHVGDIVVVRQISPLDARIGDIVTFRDATDPSRLITHRVRRIELKGNNVAFETKGDANTSVEHWRVARDGTIGLVLYRVPRLGYVLFYIHGPLGRFLLVVLPALLLGGYELWRIWAPQPTRTSTPDEEAVGATA